MNAERQRLEDDRHVHHFWEKPWRKWGPYVSERQWGTVREDYSGDGDAWQYFSHDQARSRAYRWGEDGIAGFSDRECRLCLALALWNGRDPILKERLYGLANPEGNHGEDVKESYYYLDATPTHSYVKSLYKYPQAEFPYARLVEENRGRGRLDREYELLDTGVFDEDRYFDVFVEYAKGGPDDVLMLVTAHNRGPEPAPLHLLPHLWFRNTWSWQPDLPRPELSAVGAEAIAVQHPAVARFPSKTGYHALDGFRLFADGAPELLFTDNDSNNRRLFQTDGQAGFWKDAIHEYVIRGVTAAVNPQRAGTKAAAHYSFTVPAGGAVRVRLRLTNATPAAPFGDFDQVLRQRRAEADDFYGELQSDVGDPDARLVQRQAWANLVWNRQFYYLDVSQWLDGDPGQPPPPPSRRHGRNRDWTHLNNADVLTMPDKWEYPYYCVWDTSFQCVAIAVIDPEWAKHELVLLLREWYMHPNGAVPAYEWNFDDVNAPVYAWAAWRVFEIDRDRRGVADLDFLERVFHKLALNFTWWVNRKDAGGLNVFQGGFLGMDNVSVFDRSAPLPGGGRLEQADGTAWMATFSLQMMRMSLELARRNHVYEDMATKFFEHFLHIAEAMTNVGGAGVGLWDEEDRFYYDHLRLPGGGTQELRLRSMVGLAPIYAVEVLEPELLDELPDFHHRLRWFLRYRPDLAALVSHWDEPGRGRRRLLSLLRGSRLKALLRRLLDETEFLSDHGPRTLSRVYKDRPYVLECDGQRLGVAYRSGESDSGMFGGNSNWRGPVWMPVAYLLVESLRRFHRYYGDDFKVECPTGSGRYLTIWGVAEELGRRMTRLFLRDEGGRRAAFGDSEKLQSDPHFRDYLLFHEYFDGDDGRGLGTLHQGWTCLAAVMLLQPCGPETWQGEAVCPQNAEGDQATHARPTGAASTVGM
jgi:hypothetical protein